MATAATTISITPNSVYAFCALVFCVRHCKAQPVALLVVWCVPALPGNVAQFVPVCTFPKIWIPIDSMIAIAINAPTRPMIVLDSANVIFVFVF